MQKIDFIRYLTEITSLNCICYRTVIDPESGATDYEIVAGQRMLEYETEFSGISASGVKISEAASNHHVMRWLNMVVSDLQKQHLNKSIRCVKISNIFYIVTIFLLSDNLLFCISERYNPGEKCDFMSCISETSLIDHFGKNHADLPDDGMCVKIYDTFCRIQGSWDAFIKAKNKTNVGSHPYDDIIELLFYILHIKNDTLHEHSGRMIDHSRCIAQRLLLDAETINNTVLLAIFHDIGKIGICDEVLNKSGKLTYAEREIIKMHSEIGYEIMDHIPGFSAISRYILAHHEWWNGQGYPTGLHGKDIPIPCRIVSVADAYDVMISGRTYQSARSHEEALMELKRCANTQFDPMIVEMFLHLCHA